MVTGNTMRLFYKKLNQKTKEKAQQENVLVQQENVLAGNGYMKDDTYVEYTPAEKVHIQSANTNKDAEYTDTSRTPQDSSYTDTSPYKKEEYVQETVLGGVKTKKRKLNEKGSMSVLGGSSVLGW
jgi:hypothetical protein